jgi:hypothetical protein
MKILNLNLWGNYTHRSAARVNVFFKFPIMCSVISLPLPSIFILLPRPDTQSKARNMFSIQKSNAISSGYWAFFLHIYFILELYYILCSLTNISNANLYCKTFLWMYRWKHICKFIEKANYNELYTIATLESVALKKGCTNCGTNGN